MVPYPIYEQETGKLLGITQKVGQIVILGDPDDNGFGGDNKPLWSCYQRNKMKNPFSCTLLSFKKYPIKSNFNNTEERSEVFCYMPQLCGRKEEANKSNKSNSNKQPYVPFVNINKETFGSNFVPTDLVSEDNDKRLLSRNCIKRVIRLMIKNKKQIINYLDSVIKHLPDNRDFTVFGQKKYNDHSSSRFVLTFLKFFYTVAENLLIYLHL